MFNFFKSNNTILREAIKKNDLLTIKQVIGKGADPNVGYLLHFAVESDRYEIVEFLITNRETREPVDVNIKWGYGKTLLHMAAHRGNLKMVKLLLSKGARKWTEDDQGHTPAYNCWQWTGSPGENDVDREKIIKLLS